MYRLLHIITDTNIGGAGLLLINQLRHFDREKFDISVVIPEKSELSERIRALDYDIIYTKHGADKSFEVGAIAEYVKIIRGNKPDIVHCHSALSARVAAKITGVPVCIHTRHCAYPPVEYLKKPPMRWMLGGFNNILSDGIVAVADAAAKDLTDVGTDTEKIRVIINGVEPLRMLDESEKADFRKSLGIKSDDFVAGMFARLEECKGHIYLFEAVSQMDGDSKIKLLICGRGSLENKLKEKAAELGIENRVVFAGFCSDITPYMNITDVNVNCSVGTETSSLALSEGMSVGKAAVVSDYGGNGAMVENGVTGYVIPKADPDALASVLSHLERDRALLNRMSEASFIRYREKFTAERMTRQLEDFYIECIDSQKDRSLKAKAGL